MDIVVGNLAAFPWNNQHWKWLGPAQLPFDQPVKPTSQQYWKVSPEGAGRRLVVAVPWMLFDGGVPMAVVLALVDAVGVWAVDPEELCRSRWMLLSAFPIGREVIRVAAAHLNVSHYYFRWLVVAIEIPGEWQCSWNCS